MHLALEEVKADYTFYAVDIRDQPLMAWYAETINPIGKVRYISVQSFPSLLD